jgi:hypothetical protein
LCPGEECRGTIYGDVVISTKTPAPTQPNPNNQSALASRDLRQRFFVRVLLVTAESHFFGLEIVPIAIEIGRSFGVQPAYFFYELSEPAGHFTFFKINRHHMIASGKPMNFLVF